jgi:hypothetical protein
MITENQPTQAAAMKRIVELGNDRFSTMVKDMDSSTGAYLVIYSVVRS